MTQGSQQWGLFTRLLEMKSQLAETQPHVSQYRIGIAEARGTEGISLDTCVMSDEQIKASLGHLDHEDILMQNYNAA